MKSVSLAELCGGEAVELFNRRLAEVMSNIMDPNTPAKTTRKITLELTLKPNENDREIINTSVNVKTSPSAPKALEGRMFAGITSKGDVVFTEENPRQQNLFPEEANQEIEQRDNVTPIRKEAAK